MGRTVLECSSTLREALHQLSNLAQLTRHQTTQVDPHLPPADKNYGIPMIDGSNGKVIKVLESTKCYRLRRDKLRKLLSTGLDIRYGKEIAKIEVRASDSREVLELGVARRAAHVLLRVALTFFAADRRLPYRRCTLHGRDTEYRPLAYWM